MTGTYTKITVKPVSNALGAEIDGVDLRDLDDTTFNEIRAAFAE